MKAQKHPLLQACKDFTRALKGISKPGDIANTRKLRAECRRATENWQVRKSYREDPKLKKTIFVQFVYINDHFAKTGSGQT